MTTHKIVFVAYRVLSFYSEGRQDLQLGIMKWLIRSSGLIFEKKDVATLFTIPLKRAI